MVLELKSEQLQFFHSFLIPITEFVGSNASINMVKGKFKVRYGPNPSYFLDFISLTTFAHSSFVPFLLLPPLLPPPSLPSYPLSPSETN